MAIDRNYRFTNKPLLTVGAFVLHCVTNPLHSDGFVTRSIRHFGLFLLRSLAFYCLARFRFILRHDFILEFGIAQDFWG